MKQWLVLTALICFSTSVFAETPTLLLRSKRVQILEQADLKTEAGAMDELDQDMLVWRARKISLTDLQKKYPKLPAAKLKRLQETTRSLP